MKTQTLEELSLKELQFDEIKKINGGGNPIWIGIGIGFGAMVVYDFINGVYTGIKEELENPPVQN